jgi:hypothetical protein
MNEKIVEEARKIMSELLMVLPVDGREEIKDFRAKIVEFGEKIREYAEKPLKENKRGVIWVIFHPGTGEKQFCDSFEECMETWFEGFNIPIKFEAEDFKTSHNRVKEYLNKEKLGLK